MSANELTDDAALEPALTTIGTTIAANLPPNRPAPLHPPPETGTPVLDQIDLTGRSRADRTGSRGRGRLGRNAEAHEACDND